MKNFLIWWGRGIQNYYILAWVECLLFSVIVLKSRSVLILAFRDAEMDIQKASVLQYIKHLWWKFYMGISSFLFIKGTAVIWKALSWKHPDSVSLVGCFLFCVSFSNFPLSMQSPDSHPGDSLFSAANTPLSNIETQLESLIVILFTAICTDCNLRKFCPAVPLGILYSGFIILSLVGDYFHQGR